MSIDSRKPLFVRLGLLSAVAASLLACTSFISPSPTLAQTPAVAPTTAPASQPASPLEGYPRTILGDEDFRVEVANVGGDKAYYQGQRFDHTGMIQRVVYKGHVYFDRYQTTPRDPKAHDDLGGLVEEFGIQNPPGYAETVPGGPFLKVGVGLLNKRDKDVYMFWTPYEVLAPTINHMTSSRGKVTYVQTLRDIEGWGYKYTKTISLGTEKEGEIVISRTLVNAGSKPIKVEHYSHNFMFFDGKEIDSSYKLEMPQPIIVENKDFLASAKLDGNTISPSKHLDGMAGTLFTLADPKAPFTFKVSNDNGASVTITQSIAPPKFQLWMTTRAFCPEPFTVIDLAPGKSIEWSTTYQFGQ